MKLFVKCIEEMFSGMVFLLYNLLGQDVMAEKVKEEVEEVVALEVTEVVVIEEVEEEETEAIVEGEVEEEVIVVEEADLMVVLIETLAVVEKVKEVTYVIIAINQDTLPGIVQIKP